LSSEGRTKTTRVRRILAAACDRRGIAAIELGMVVPAILVILLGTFDVGNYVLQQTKLAEAANIGAQYAISYPLDTAGITSVVQTALPPAWTDVAITAPLMTCGCATSSGQVAASCSGNPVCPTGETTQRFVTIKVQRNYTPLLVLGLTSTTASYVAQVQ
jgi:Flp pilus assembly protein TadG